MVYLVSALLCPKFISFISLKTNQATIVRYFALSLLSSLDRAIRCMTCVVYDGKLGVVETGRTVRFEYLSSVRTIVSRSSWVRKTANLPSSVRERFKDRSSVRTILSLPSSVRKIFKSAKFGL